MELTGIITGLLLGAGGLTALTGLAAHTWASHCNHLLRTVLQRAAALAQWPWPPARIQRVSSERHQAGIFAVMLTLGLAMVATAAAGLGVLVDAVTEADGIAAVDHPIARFVTTHRAQPLTSLMRAVSAAGGPMGMTVLAVAAGAVLTIAWRSWVPAVVMATADAGAIGLTLVLKAVLGLARPPLAQAVTPAGGYGFPSAHAAVATAVCGAAVWLVSTRMRSWRGRVAAWAAAAMLATLIGISRVYLGVHWTTDVIGGGACGVLWLTVIIICWAASRFSARQRHTGGVPRRC